MVSAASSSGAPQRGRPSREEGAYADAGRITQVLSNLIGNAVKFTPDAGAVTIEAVLDGAFVRFTIRDTGIGIPAEDLPFVFDRFWQSRRTNRSGAGLGLAIARGIVLGHGGGITMQSVPNAGTTVQFTLPTRESADGAR